MATNWRQQVGTRHLVVALSLLAAVILAYLIDSRGIKIAVVAVGAPCVLYWIVRQPGNGLILAVVVLLTIPGWYPHVWLVAPIAAVAGLSRGIAKSRVRLVDGVVLLFAIAMAGSWILHRSLGVSTKTFVEEVLPLGYYLWSRLAITDRLLPRLQWAILLAGTAAALTVLYEALRATPIFQPPLQYEWRGSATAIFRAGGIFGGSPAAATCLAMVLLISAPLYRRRPKEVGAAMLVIVASIVMTFDRAGILALCAGLLVLSLLLPYRHWARAAMVVLALSIPIYAVTTSSSTLSGVTSSRLISQGVVRSSTITERVRLASTALALLPSSPSDLAFGQGFDALLGPPGLVPSSLAVNPSLLASGGPNDDYLRSLLEQGITGLGLMILWLGVSIVVGVRTCLQLPKGSDQRALVAGLTAAVFGYSLAIIGHDATHNVPMLSMAALATGMLVSVCSLER